MTTENTTQTTAAKATETNARRARAARIRLDVPSTAREYARAVIEHAKERDARWDRAHRTRYTYTGYADAGRLTSTMTRPADTTKPVRKVYGFAADDTATK